jgi:hypothetical protein
MWGKEIRSMMIRKLGAARLDRCGLHGVRYQYMVHDERQPCRRAIWGISMYQQQASDE